MNPKTLPTASPADTPEDLRVRVAELADINDGLIDLIREQRAGYHKVIEDMLLTFAAHGYRPAARALLDFRRALDGIAPKGTH